MTALVAFLSILAPQLVKYAPLAEHLPGLFAMLKTAFTRVGGVGADFDKILVDNQIDIDRLADPDSFRKTRLKKPTTAAATKRRKTKGAVG